MEPNYSVYKDDNRFFRYRYNSSIALLAGLLLFLLPFARIKCGTIKVAENTGFGLVTGKQWNVSFMGMDNELFGDLQGKDKGSGNRLANTQPQWFITFAALIAFCGLGISLSQWEGRWTMAMSASILAVVLMAVGYINLKMQMKSMPFDDAYESGGLGTSGFIKLKFTIWYFLSLLLFTIAGIFSYKHHRIDLQEQSDSMMLFEFQQEAQIATDKNESLPVE